MADTKITALAAITTIDTANDVLPIVDVDDHSMAASGTTKRVTTNQLLGSGGTATLASATITGNATAAAFIPSGSSIPSNGIYLPSANNVGFAYNSTLGMTLNSTGLGIGATPISRLHSSNGSSSDSGLFTGLTIGGTGASSARTASFIKNTSSPYDLIIRTQDFTSGTSGSFIVQNGSTEQFRIDSSGNVGIGVTPSAWQASWKALDVSTVTSVWGNVNTSIISSNVFFDGALKYKTATSASYLQQQSKAFQFFQSSDASPTAGGAATFAQAMTLDASGNLLVGLTADSFQPTKGIAANASNSSRISVGHANGTASGDYYHSFAYNGAVIGSITQNGTTGVLYNITSDYRLKESVKPLVGGLARVNALKPSVYKWKSDGSNGEGFLAHELAEVVPFAVSGEKDAVNEDGSIKSQGIDMSRVVPILVAAIQELTARVQTLETR